MFTLRWRPLQLNCEMSTMIKRETVSGEMYIKEQVNAISKILIHKLFLDDAENFSLTVDDQ